MSVPYLLSDESNELSVDCDISSDLIATESPWFTHRPSPSSPEPLNTLHSDEVSPLDGFRGSYVHKYTFRVVKSRSNLNVMLINKYVPFVHN